MTDLLALQKDFLKRHIKPGGIAVDFTMGNGHDTLWLSETVGASGKVYAFDVQQKAISSTRRLLEANGAPQNYTLIYDSHSECDSYIHERINAGVFNLGYLPGSDKKITTMCETTRAAVSSAINLLAPDGILLVAVYPGHAEGTAEGDMLAGMLSLYDRRRYCCSVFRIINSPTSPFFYTVESK
ncbi:MAG: class I SAM-dependent methyltransferase [Eubacteriales bacterium]